VGYNLGTQTAAPFGGKQTVSPQDQWDMVKVWEMQELYSAPPAVTGMGPRYGPYGILAVCRIKLRPDCGLVVGAAVESTAKQG
jgi:hypothetical protein